jgi:hypothetical protein
MNRNILVLIAVVAGLTLAASAGTISGKVSGVAGDSVVYVDTITGKTFPVPTQQLHRGRWYSLLCISDQAGNYKIENVTDGNYTVTAWHEGAKNQSKTVAVHRFGESKVDFTLTK